MALPPSPTAPAGALGQLLSGAELQAALDWYNNLSATTPGPRAVETHLRRLATGVGTNPEYTALLQRHGTAVTGIAAGNGRGPGDASTPPMPGVAPEADLVLIAIGAHDETRFGDSSEVLAAFHAAFEDPTAPCVALMANSDNLGPHDGSLDGERFLDELLLQPGRAIVLTAGNFNHLASSSPGGGAWHALAHANSGSGPQLPLILRYGPGAASPDSAEVWFRPPAGTAATATISIKVRGNSIGPPVAVTESATPVTLLAPAQNPNERTTVHAQLQRDDEADAYCLLLVFHPALSEEIAPSEWTVDVTAEGPVHAWLDRNNNDIGHWDGQPAQAGAGLTTLGSPACAARSLTVGSVTSPAGNPSSFSGRGPLRAANGSRKPDVVAVGENAKAPCGVPHVRRQHLHPADSAYQPCHPPSGTSYAAPQVAGACALLFQRFGSAATWADIRQAILQATVRPSGMPAPDTDTWDHACGYGLLDLNTLLAPPPPVTADLWLPKTAEDSGTEPFVGWTFWDSPALVLEDAEGRALHPAAVAAGEAAPARLRVRVANRGHQPARDVVLTVWWASVGSAHPLPREEVGGGAWRANGFGIDGEAGNLRRMAQVAPGAAIDRIFDWMPPRDEEGRIIPHLLLAAVDAEGDAYDPNDTICSQNNVAMLCIAAARDGTLARIQILGSEDTDGLILWRDDANSRLRIENLPVTALPWRDAAMFEASGRRNRPLFGSADATEDLALALSARLEGRDAIAEITGVLGAETLALQNGQVTIDGGARLVLPRLRIARGTPLELQIAALGLTGGGIHVLHLSGGRRVGGGTVQVAAQDRRHSSMAQ